MTDRHGALPNSSPAGTPARALSGTYDRWSDACGVGSSPASQQAARCVVAGINALKAVWHRAVDAKRDGAARRHPCRIRRFLRRGDPPRRRPARPGPIRVGQVFLPKPISAQGAAGRSSKAKSGVQLPVYGWRQVPINVACIGEDRGDPA